MDNPSFFQSAESNIMCLYQDICFGILKVQMCKLSDISECNDLYVEKDVHMDKPNQENDSIVPLTSTEH